MNSSLRQRLLHDLQLAGLSARTQEAYVRAVRQLADHFHTPPDRLTEPQLRDYFLHFKNDRQFGAASLGIAYSGIKFFSAHTIPRDWPTLKRLRVPREKRLPDVLSVDEVRRLIAAVRTPHNRTYFQTVNSLGLRFNEGHFLVSVKALSIRFRAKFRDLLECAGLRDAVALSVWRQDWVVHCQPAGDGRESLRYLAPDVFRVAIGDDRIVSCDDGQVTFTSRKVGSNRRRTMTLEATEFLRRFLQHVLPSGFPKVRHYGFLSPASGVTLDLVRWLIALWAGLTYVLQARRAVEATEPVPSPRCPACGGVLVRLGFVPAPVPAVFDTS